MSNSLQDQSPMPFGKYKGTPMEEVPANYLHWIWTNFDNKSGPVFEYIKEHMTALKQEHPDGIWE